jgi:two-component system chemotaxis sensor kinase CheA
MDRSILEEINAPLVHLLRNAIYHGIESPKERISQNKNETGILKLRTYRRAGLIYIEVSDDGNGIDYDKIREKTVDKEYYTAEEVKQLQNETLDKFLLMPGFSTITDADIISGRGMGLAIVDEKIKKLGGSFQIYSERGKGSKFTIIVPFTRTIIKAQILEVAGDLFAIPTDNIKQIHFFNPEAIEYTNGTKLYQINSSLVPIVQLEDILNLPDNKKVSPVNNNHSKVAILCKKDEESLAVLIADDLLEQIDAVVKPFKSDFSISNNISGSTIMSDGAICLILDIFNIIRAKYNELNYSQLKDIY